MRHPAIDCAKSAPGRSAARFPWALLIVVGGIFLLASTSCAGDAEAPTAVDRAETLARFSSIPQRGIALGDPAAPVTLTIFVDLQCHFCREFARRVEPALIERYARTGEARLVLRNLAFLGPESRAAARMAGAVGLQAHLWQFTDLLLAASASDGSATMTDEYLRVVAGAIPRVDVARAVADRGSSAVTAQLDAANAEAARFGIHGAPAFLLGKTGAEAHVLKVNRLTPDAFTDPIDALLRSR